MLKFALLAILATGAIATEGDINSFGPLPRSDCSLLPRALPSPPRHPPALEDPCDFTECPSAPNECYVDSVCRFGLCMEPEPKPLGTPCDDGDDSTTDDVCGGDGVCKGIALECPADQEHYDSESIIADWEVPNPNYHGIPFVTRSNRYNPGDELTIGRYTITYTANGRTLDGRDLKLECSFTVLVKDNCRDVVCGSPSACEEEGVCVDGECIFDAKDDGSECAIGRDTGACIAGECVDVCAGVSCRGDHSVCRMGNVCEPQGTRGVCVDGPALPNGDYALTNPIGLDFPDLWKETVGIHTSASCRNGDDVCMAPYRHLPASMPSLPPHPPSLQDPCNHVDCPAPPNECYMEATCSEGACQRHEPRRVGFVCDDGDDSTPFDICGAGKCSGVRYQCPPSRDFFPDDETVMAVVDWDTPVPDYHGIDFAIESNFGPGAKFGVGFHEIIYTATGRNPNGDNIEVSCSFEVRVFDPCQGVRCETSNPCEEASCVGGQCVLSAKDNGDSCDLGRGETGACVAGICEDLCRDVQCGAEMGICRQPSRCALDGLQPFCNEGDPLPNGNYPTDEQRQFPPEWGPFGDPEQVRCAEGENVCGGVYRHQPRPLLAPPPHPPALTREVTTEFVVPTSDDNVIVEICVGSVTSESNEACECDPGCHACTWANGVNGECLTCSDSLYLLETNCVTEAECIVAEGVPIGSNELGRRCNFEVNSTSTTTTTIEITSSDVTTETPDEFECKGGKTADGSSCNCVNLRTCNTCMVNFDRTAATCTICSNSQYLLDGQCISQCPSGFTGRGSGRFRRRCEAVEETTTTTARVTTPRTGAPELCASGKLSTDGGRCSCGINSCHTCTTGTNPQCTICAAQKYLLNGRCVERCPTGFDELGSGNFKRRCQAQAGVTLATTTAPISDAVECVSGKTPTGASCSCSGLENCNMCMFSPSLNRHVGCARCKNQAYLNPDNTCKASCPTGFEQVGQGNFNRKCRAIPGAATDAPLDTTTTTVGPIGDVAQCKSRRLPNGQSCSCGTISDCSVCDYSVSQQAPVGCTICGNAKFLVSTGTCEDSCPQGFIERGSGNFRRHCEAAAGRQRRSMADEPESVTKSASSGFGMGVFAVFSVLAAVGAAVHFRRRSSGKLLPEVAEDEVVPKAMDSVVVDDASAKTIEDAYKLEC